MTKLAEIREKGRVPLYPLVTLEWMQFRMFVVLVAHLTRIVYNVHISAADVI